MGVLGYVLKENAVDDVVDAIRAVASGDSFISPSVSAFLLGRSRRTKELRKQKPGLEKLTPAERRILKQIAEDKTSKEIADELSISVRTVDDRASRYSSGVFLFGQTAAAAQPIEDPGDPMR